MVKPNGSQVRLKKQFIYDGREFDKDMILTLWDGFYYTKNDVDMFKWISAVEINPLLMLNTAQLREVYEMTKQIRIPADAVKPNEVFEELKTNPITNLQKFNIN